MYLYKTSQLEIDTSVMFNGLRLLMMLTVVGKSWGNIHSRETPRGRDDSAANTLVEKVLRSTNASILLILTVVRVLVERFGGWELEA